MWNPRRHIEDDGHVLSGGAGGQPGGVVEQDLIRSGLVVDDEPQIVRALKVVLREAGFEAVPAETASQALDLAAWTLCWLDRRVEAAAMLREAARGRFEANAGGGGVAPGTSEITALVLYADAATQTDDTETCSILYERIQPFGDQLDWNGATARGHTRMYLGLLAGVLGKHEEADRHLAFACEFQEAHGMLLSAARAQLGWAEALAGRGDTGQAREHAARALELSREHGYGLFEERAAALGAPKSAAEADGR